MLHNEVYKSLFYKNREEIFLPLNHYLESNETYMGLPKKLRDMLVDENGQIWGLMKEHTFHIPIRLYNEKILNEINEDIPTNPNELQEVLLKVNTFYKEQDGIMAMVASANNCLHDFQDIFNAYNLDIYLNKYTIGWNENTNSYEDSALITDMDKLLNYFSYILETKLVTVYKEENINRGQMLEQFNNDNLFTLASTISARGNTSEFYSFDLNESDSKHIYSSSANMYFIPKNIENPSLVVNTFINMFYKELENNVIGKYGLDFEIIDDVVRVKTHNPYDLINISGMWFNNPYFAISNDATNAEMEIRKKTSKQYFDYLNKRINNGTVFIPSPITELSKMDRKNTMDIHLEFNYSLIIV